MLNHHLQKRAYPIALLVVLGACGGDDETSSRTSLDPNDPVNSVPMIDGMPSSEATVGVTYEFVPVATDADEDMLTFSIDNRPGWATFSPATGTLWGTPTTSHAGVYGNIVISVSDGEATRSLNPFSITVASTTSDRDPNEPVNSAPMIDGMPSSEATVGVTYEFVPVVTDADEDMLTFSIDNRPGWATFSPATGSLSGTPRTNHAGVYRNIVISVSDGEATRSLNPFSITVASTTLNRSVTLSWKAPTKNTDGSKLTNLAGYHVHYGTAPRNFTESLNLSDRTMTSVVIEGLAPARWYFAVKAYNTAGLESDFSDSVDKLVR